MKKYIAALVLGVMLAVGLPVHGMAAPDAFDRWHVWVDFGADPVAGGTIDRDLAARIEAYIASHRSWRRDWYIIEVAREHYGNQGEYDIRFRVTPRSADVIAFSEIAAIIGSRCRVGFTQVSYRANAHTCEYNFNR
jgi:hypothetical protein